MTRRQRGRELARAELALAVAIAVFAGLMFVAAPAYMGGGRPSETPIALIALGAGVFGLVWMIRIYRADPEPDQHIWRYRE